MRTWLRAWFGRPAPGASRADVMRWIRRLNIGGGVLCMLFALQLRVSGLELWWVLAGIGAVNVVDGIALMPRRIRRLEAMPEPERPSAGEVARRKQRAMAVMAALYVLGGAVGGFVAGGAVGLAVGAVLGGVVSIVGARLARRWPIS
jgi:hypothetical protein